MLVQGDSEVILGSHAGHPSYKARSAQFLHFPLSSSSNMQAVNNIVNSISQAVTAVTGSGKPVVEKPSDRAWWKSSVVYQGEPSLAHR